MRKFYDYLWGQLNLSAQFVYTYDNFVAHEWLEREKKEVVPLPPNQTQLSQVIDCGLGKAVKDQYAKLLNVAAEKKDFDSTTALTPQACKDRMAEACRIVEKGGIKQYWRAAGIVPVDSPSQWVGHRYFPDVNLEERVRPQFHNYLDAWDGGVDGSWHRRAADVPDAYVEDDHDALLQDRDLEGVEHGSIPEVFEDGQAPPVEPAASDSDESDDSSSASSYAESDVTESLLDAFHECATPTHLREKLFKNFARSQRSVVHAVNVVEDPAKKVPQEVWIGPSHLTGSRTNDSALILLKKCCAENLAKEAKRTAEREREHQKHKHARKAKRAREDAAAAKKKDSRAK